MSTQDESVLVKLLKKSVGLPTAGATCCAAPSELAAKNCCGSTASSECCAEGVAAIASAECCEKAASEQEQEEPQKA